jgi:hypothetical protein
MSKPVIILITIAAWGVGCAFTAYVYVTSHLGLPGTDAYADTWGFQLLTFGVLRFPFWLVGLLGVISAEIVMLKPARRKLS